MDWSRSAGGGPPEWRPPWGEWEQMALRLRRRLGRGLWFYVLAAAALIWGLSGVYMIGPGEVGVVRQFGREHTVTSPGLRYHVPWPVQHVIVVDVDSVRTAQVGFRTERGETTTVAREAMMLTGDENIIQIHLFVQYRVQDPSDFVFRVRDPEQVLHSAAEVALRGVVGNFPIDYTMTDGRAEVQQLAQQSLQQLLDSYRTGLLVTEARLLTADPPNEVRDAFHEVVRALEDRERLVQEAEGYREDVVPRARGEAAQVVADAEAYREQRILEAQGDVARFVSVYDEYARSPGVTRERMYLEVMEEVLGGVQLVIIDPSVGNQTLPLFSIDRMLPGGGGQ